jgi:hypothetical protein
MKNRFGARLYLEGHGQKETSFRPCRNGYGRVRKSWGKARFSGHLKFMPIIHSNPLPSKHLQQKQSKPSSDQLRVITANYG